MNKLSALSFLLIFFSFASKAQEVIATTGEFFSNSSASLSWTLGEVMTETYTVGGSHLTQGQQQTNYDPVLSFEALPDIQMSVYPNPTQDRLTVVSDKSDLTYNLQDSRGRVVLSDHSNKANFYIHMTDMEDGIYYLQIYGSNQELIKIFKIVKL